ncbi:helix-turn-helix domain-containing protein [Streptomyces sp. NPDC055607]
MQTNPLDHAARVAAETDPARRYQAAKVAAEAAAAAAAAPYEQIAEQAVDDLIAQHGGNKAAAAGELGLTRQALYMRDKREKTSGGARTAAAEQVQPARHFNSPQEAEDALRDWAGDQQEVTDQLDVLLLGALAAGADPVTISELSGIPLATLRRIRPAGNIAVSRLNAYGSEIEDFARAVHARAAALRAAASTEAEHRSASIWQHAARVIVTNAAPYALMPDPGIHRDDFDTAEEFVEALVAREPSEEEKAEDKREPSRLAILAGPDAYLAATYISFRREAARERPSYEEKPEEIAAGEAVRAAFGELADAILHLRTTGQVPPALLEAS